MVIVESNLSYNDDAVIFSGSKCYENLETFIIELQDYIRVIIGKNSIKVITDEVVDGFVTFTTVDEDDLQRPLNYSVNVDGFYSVPIYNICQLLDCFSCCTDDTDEYKPFTTWAYWLLDL